ncbi:RHS repeat domain-containing protein [Lacrimispora sp. BS-2]|uniref:RHS repeat domain-containing protein n=1 Tax=Lacrimispora sp. BS-2 TaxID=3151850 RepID=UPI0032F07251
MYSYNKAGKLEEIMNAAGNKRRYQYNDSGRIIEIKDFDNSIHQMEGECKFSCVQKSNNFLKLN